MKILIIGCGWYGCMIALLCMSQNIDFIILDNTLEIFNGSSSNNQNRLHLGYHYPRSIETINECKKGYIHFTFVFEKFINDIIYNVYAIENTSRCNFSHYDKLFAINSKIISIGLFEEKTKLQLSNEFEKMFVCDEKIIKHNLIKNRFNELLKNHIELIVEDNLICHDSIIYNGVKYDYLFNCTYGQSQIGFKNLDLNCFYELCISFLYENIISDGFSLTIMDGDFISLYPYEARIAPLSQSVAPSSLELESHKNLYTLTHVKYTPLFKDVNIENVLTFKNNLTTTNIITVQKTFENEAMKYIKNFNDIFVYHNYFLSIKCKFGTSDDDRSLKYFCDGNKFMFIGGKITGIFSMYEIISEKLGINIDLGAIKRIVEEKI